MNHQDLPAFTDGDTVVAVGDHEIGQHRAGLEREAPQPSRNDLSGLRIGELVHIAQATKTWVGVCGRNAGIAGNEGRSG
jgi:hypothetical protein